MANNAVEMSQLNQVKLYTDGACSGNPGPGGWGVVLLWRDEELRLQGGEPETTNNRMELTAAIKGLEALKRPCQVALYSDSAYLVNAFLQRWITKWQSNGWRKANKQAVENQDLWKSLLDCVVGHDLTWHKVKGHSDDTYNRICDSMAREEAAKYSKPM